MNLTHKPIEFSGLFHGYIPCHSKELRKKLLGITLVETPIVVFRTKSGQVAALEDCCAHRHTPPSQKTICQTQLEYSYHCGQYGTDGRVSSVSTLPANCAIPENLRIKSFHGLEQEG